MQHSHQVDECVCADVKPNIQVEFMVRQCDVDEVVGQGHVWVGCAKVADGVHGGFILVCTAEKVTGFGVAGIGLSPCVSIVEKRDVLEPCLLGCVDLSQKAEGLGARCVLAQIVLDEEDGVVLELKSCCLFVYAFAGEHQLVVGLQGFALVDRVMPAIRQSV